MKKRLKSLNPSFELSFSLAKTSFKLRNENSYLGILWYLLEPLITFLIFLLIQNVMGADIPNYPIYLFTGLIIYNFFRKATTGAVNSIYSNQNLIQTIRIEKWPFVVSSFLSSVFSHFFEIILLIFFMVWFDVPLTGLIFYPLVFFILSVFVLGISFMTATLGVYLRDFPNIWSVLTRLLWFATPIFYSAKLDLAININVINPMYYFITLSRDLMVYRSLPDPQIVLGCILFAFGAFIIGFFVFDKYKNKFAEAI